MILFMMDRTGKQNILLDRDHVEKDMIYILQKDAGAGKGTHIQ